MQPLYTPTDIRFKIFVYMKDGNSFSAYIQTFDMMKDYEDMLFSMDTVSGFSLFGAHFREEEEYLYSQTKVEGGKSWVFCDRDAEFK